MSRQHGAGLSGTRLFERLATPEHEPPTEYRERLAATLESIKRHLVDLLNSHPGNSECAPELGLLDFNDATSGVLDLELNIQRAIGQCIECFEPRVCRVRVETLPNPSDPLQLHFQVHATLALGSERTQTTIDLLLNDKRYQCLN